MKKLITLGMFVATFGLAASSAMANGTPAPQAVAEGVEISGNVTIVTGYQHDSKNTNAGTVGGGAAAVPGLGGMGDVVGQANDATVGRNAPRRDVFRFVVDQVELDIQKSFGENIRLRADIDIGDFNNTVHRSGTASGYIDLEQAYVTANIAWGNGVEFLIGKFNAPIGVESVDRHQNWLISYASPFRYFTPTNLTGAKIYYAFSDLVDWHVYVVNNLNGGFVNDSAIPSFGTRLGFNWGSEEKKNTIGLSVAGGPEQAYTATRGANAHWDWLVDADLMIAASDTVTVAAEAVYRQTNHLPAAGYPRNQKGFAGFVAVNYQVSDTWDVTFRLDAAYDVNPNPGFGAPINSGSGASTTGGNWFGYEGKIFDGSIGAGYKIADGAKMKLEYTYAYGSHAGYSPNDNHHSVMAEFAYTF